MDVEVHVKYDEIVLDGRYREVPSSGGGLLSLARKNREFAFSAFLSHIHALENDRTVTDILLFHRAGFRAPGFAVLEEIGSAMAALTTQGKRVHYYADNYTESTAFLASYATKRYMHPLGTVTFLGFSQSLLYSRALLNRIGVEPIVARRGRYKSAADTLKYDKRQEADAEQVRRYLDVTDARVATRLKEIPARRNATGTDLPPQQEGTYLFAEQAVDRGWMDELRTEEELRDRWREDKKAKRAKLRRHAQRHGRGKRIAVLAVDGTIVDGESRSAGSSELQVGARTIAEQARTLKKDRRTAGVVVRINSPGGSATGAEVIRRALLSLAERKPTVVSFGALAASGGYWISALGKQIFASDTTVTGSIGAVVVYPVLQNLLRRFAVYSDTVKTGAHSDFPSALRSPTSTERRYLERQLDEVYRQFLERVAHARKLDLDRVDELAQGRVWAGVDARDNQLVDARGGLAEALAALRSEMGTDRTQVRFYPEEKRSLLQRLLTRRGISAERSPVTNQFMTAAASAAAPFGGALPESTSGDAAGALLSPSHDSLMGELLGELAPLATLPAGRPLLYADMIPLRTV
jgi:protease-4